MSIDNWPPRFTLETKSVLKLFTGDRFYSSADASIREAILNAIDACSRRKATDASTAPDIRVVFDEQAGTITISDNGIGMDKQELADLFAKVGASASTLLQRPEAAQVKTIGEFGIGVVSYFLACDRYHVHTLRAESEPLGLEFSIDMLDGLTPAKPLVPAQESIGTTVVFFVRDGNIFKLLLSKFSHWARSVEGLRAVKSPSAEEVHQGGLSKDIRPVNVTVPSWVEKAELGPPRVFTVWDHLDGKAHVDILYRGVYVDRVEANGLWSIEGAIHVDPTSFRPKLNREGFVGTDLQQEVTRFLHQVHPMILAEAVNCVKETLGEEETKDWTILRWVTLWLAVPRSGAYTEVARLWDEEFRHRRAFRLLGPNETQREISVADLQTIPEKIYIAPARMDQATTVVQQAVRVARARGLPVVQGIMRDSNYLPYASLTAASTADLLLNFFRDSLPPMERVEETAAKIVSEEAVAELYNQSPSIRVVRLGVHGAPVVRVGEEIWINLDTERGRKIIQEVCDRNEGYLGFWFACLKHAPGHVGEVAGLLKGEPPSTPLLGIVRRQRLRRLAS